MEEMTLIEKELNKETIDIDKIIFISKAQDFARKNINEIKASEKVDKATKIFGRFVYEYTEGDMIVAGNDFDEKFIVAIFTATGRIVAQWSIICDDFDDWTEIYDVFLDNYYNKAIVEKLKELKELADNMKIRDINWEDLDD